MDLRAFAAHEREIQTIYNTYAHNEADELLAWFARSATDPNFQADATTLATMLGRYPVPFPPVWKTPQGLHRFISESTLSAIPMSPGGCPFA